MDATTRKIIKEIKIDCLIIWEIFVLFAIYVRYLQYLFL